MPDEPRSSQRPPEQSVRAASASPPPNGRRRDDSLTARSKHYADILDRFNALRVLRAGEEIQGDVLEEVAELGVPEHDIAEQLLAPWPLAQPERFEQAHQSMMRGLEVLERNGGRKAAVTRIGPLNPLASVIVSSVAGGIAARYRSSLLQRIRRLYATREASSMPGSPEHRMLRRARFQAAAVTEGFGGAHGGVPATALLVGGGALSAAFAVIRGTLGPLFQSKLATILLLLVLAAVVFGLAWAFLYAGGVARRRIRLSTDLSVRALWEAVGACGAPPRDHSYTLALAAIVLLLAAWLVVPVVVWLIFS
jgi:hypothetical protein